MDWEGPLLHDGGGRAALKFARALFPPDLSPEFLATALRATWQTLAYALAGLTVALIIGLPLGILASGKIFAPSSRLRLPAVVGTRAFLAGLRSIHELVWAVLFVAAMGLSPLAAIFALGLPYGGILGRIYAELLQEVPPEPLQALRVAGASPWRLVIYGYAPMSLQEMVGYTFYRFECAIRSAAVLSFVGINGLGYQLQLSLQDLLFDQVWTLLLLLVAVIVLVDLWSSRVRRSLAS